VAALSPVGEESPIITSPLVVTGMSSSSEESMTTAADLALPVLRAERRPYKKIIIEV
jgi:hypothetical protein